MRDKIHFKRRELIKSISETFDKKSFNNHSFRKNILLILNDYYQNYYLKINDKFNIEKNGKDAGLNISNLSDNISPGLPLPFPISALSILYRSPLKLKKAPG